MFANDSPIVSVDARLAINGVIEEIARVNLKSIIIGGHADRTGTDSYNDWLSFKRARNIEGILVAAGTMKERIEITSYGARKPKIQTARDVPEARNRVVEIKFVR